MEEEDSELLERLVVIELKIDAILRELALSISKEKNLMSGMNTLLEEARARKNTDNAEGKMLQMECRVVDMLSKVNGGGVNRLFYRRSHYL
jgi:hypothetical protein